MDLLRSSWILLGLAFSAVAHDWQCPSELVAAPNGSFEFEVVLVIEDSAVYNGAFEQAGISNVNGVDLVADGFCMIELQPGTELRIVVSGSLHDPSQSGVVFIHQFVCEEGAESETSWERTVTVLPATARNDRASFGMLKGRFRSR